MSTPTRIENGKYPARRTGQLAGLAAALLLCLAPPLASCGRGQGPSPRVHGRTFTIYASLPRHGLSAREAEAVAAGERLALSDAHGRAGGHRVRLVELDSSSPPGETWDPSAVEENAKRAASDPTTIAYLGELDFGGSAVSVPVTNDKQILQVSPGDGLTSLTQLEPGNAATGPQRYYPSAERTFLRIVPPDLLEAATLVDWARHDGARRVVIVHDDQLFGRELAQEAAVSAERVHLSVTDVVEAKDDPATYPALATALAGARPDAVIYAGVGGANSGPLLSALGHALPRARFYGPSSLATAAATPGGLPELSVVKPARPSSMYGGEARAVLAQLEAELGRPLQPEALYGYEAMRVVLDAIRTAGRKSNRRLDVMRAALRPRLRRSVIGTYGITASGDTSTSVFAAYRRIGERLKYVGLRGPGAAAPAP